METAFTPLQSLFGGILIGLAAVLLMASLGRIAGATGILSGALLGADRGWRIAMIAGMLTAPVAMLAVTGASPVITVPVSTLALVVGGVLVGVGVTFSSGCTSGHGVCGLARLSARSLVATLTFMGVTGVTVYVTRHLLGG